jgi:serine/threonine protein kinase
MPAKPFSSDVLAREFPGYTGFSHLKSGTFKTVHECTLSSGSIEVLKIIRLPLDSGSDSARALRDQELGRARRETSLLASIDSPYIVKLGSLAPTIRDVEGESCLVYTEELLPGRDLEAVIADGLQPSADEVKSLLVCLIKAIEVLWTMQKTVHRDIKPANLFSTGLPERPYVLLDLGIAYNVAEPGLTADPSHVPHTPRYMAPEMLDSNFRESLSFRADLYSAAVTVFEFATAGIHPLARRGDNLAKTYTRVLHQEPTLLESHRPDLPKEITSIVNQLMKKTPALRPGNFTLLLKRLK